MLRSFLTEFAVVTLVLAGIVGSSIAVAQGTEEFSFEAELGLTDTFSSETGELSRGCTNDPDATINVKLPEETLAEIAELAERTDFYSLPRSILRDPHDSGEELIIITSRCPMYSLTLNNGSDSKKVDWSCRAGPAPPRVQELYSLVTTALRPYTDQLPEVRCRFR